MRDQKERREPFADRLYFGKTTPSKVGRAKREEGKGRRDESRTTVVNGKTRPFVQGGLKFLKPIFVCFKRREKLDLPVSK